MDRIRALAESLKKLQFVSKSDFETLASIEKALHAQGIRILSHHPLRLEWFAVGTEGSQNLSSPPPTLLVSPYGLGILEVLFSKTAPELSDYRSMLQFARENRLNQPKLSHFKTYFKASDLNDLKSKLASLPFETWIHAFDYPNTAKGMTPFFKVSRAYISGTPLKYPTQIQDFFAAHELTEGKDWFPGPADQNLPDQTLMNSSESYWVTENAERKIKKHLKLVPAVFSAFESSISLARAKKDFLKEAIISPSPDSIGPNRFRTAWDLLRGEARLRETGIQMLRRLLES